MPEDMLLLDDDCQSAAPTASLSNESAALLSVVVAYLIVHPFGAPLTDICTYMRGLGCNVEQDTVADLLSSLPLVFRSDTKDGEALWMFCGFQTIGLPLKAAAQCAMGEEATSAD